MKRITFFWVLACFLAALWGAPAAKINPSKQKWLISLSDGNTGSIHTTAFYDSFFNDLHIGAFWFPAISNKGYVGYWDITAFYPGGGDQSALWQAGMWAGGYVESNPFAWRYLGSEGFDSDPAQYDTLDEQAIVETEADFGYPYPYRRLTVHVNTADKPDLPSGDDILDGDMGMDVTYEWHQWGVPGYDNWIFIHVTIGFSKSIDDFYWGWMSDCDVGDVNVPDVYFDDYAGWDDTFKFAYMRDWDYDPLPGDSVWLSPNVIGQVLLAAPPVNGPITDPPDNSQRWVSKNYWDWNNDVSSVQNQYDRLTGAWENPFPPDSPYDYRILNGVGPYQVSPGDTAHFWMAYVIGEGYDEGSHAIFGLGTLVDHVQDAQAFFDGGMVVPVSDIPPCAPDLDPDLTADVIDDSIRVHWEPYDNIAGGATADSFIVYTSTISKMGPWQRVDAFDNSVMETRLQLTPGFYTYIWVQAYDTGNEVGSNPYALSSRLYKRDDNGILRANENTIIGVFIPSTPTLLENYAAFCEGSSIVIDWVLSEIGESIEFFVLRSENTEDRFREIRAPKIVQENLSFSYRDNTCKSGGSYRYRVDVSDELGRRILFITDPITIPALSMELYQNYPNPFNPTTALSFTLPEKRQINLSVFNLKGELIKTLINNVLDAGYKQTFWDGTNSNGNSVASGIYFYRLKAGGRVLTRKMVLLR